MKGAFLIMLCVSSVLLQPAPTFNFLDLAYTYRRYLYQRNSLRNMMTLKECDTLRGNCICNTKPCIFVSKTTFRPFKRLPVELRLEIWKLSLPAPQRLHPSWRAVPISGGSEGQSRLHRRIVTLRQRFSSARRVLWSAYQNLCEYWNSLLPD